LAAERELFRDPVHNRVHSAIEDGSRTVAQAKSAGGDSLAVW
jgi:hypothetical protein